MPNVRLVDDDGAQIGIKPTAEALEYAFGKGLDLVEVAAQADPPVVRVMDYGKYRYEQEQKAKLARKHQIQVHVKEIKLRPKIGIHDYETKKGHVVRFLNQRAKVKVTIMFRGREQYHPERGRDLLMRLAEDVKEIGVDRAAAAPGRPEHDDAARPNEERRSQHRDAQAEDTQRSEEEVQGDGERTLAAAARNEEPPPREEVAEAEARRSAGSRGRASKTRATSSVCSAASGGAVMPRVKRSVHARKKRRKVLNEAKGYFGRRHSSYKFAKEQVERSLVYAYRDRKAKKRVVPPALDHAHQRGRARRTGCRTTSSSPACKKAGIELDRKVARRPRRQRSGGVRGHRRAGQGRAGRSRLNDRLAERFLSQAEACERSGSQLYADLCRRLATEPLVRGIAPDDRWDLPIRLLGGAAPPRPRRPAGRLVVGRRARRTRAASATGWRASSPSRRCRRTRCSAAGRCCPRSSRSATSGRSS